MTFCEQYNLPPIPLSERQACLFAVHLANQGLRPQSITVYLAGVRHLLVTVGQTPSPRAEWPRLQYVIRGIKRSAALTPKRQRLPITFAVLKQIQDYLFRLPPAYMTKLIWCACCLAFFGFLRCGEFLGTPGNNGVPGLKLADIAVNSHSNPALFRVFI